MRQRSIGGPLLLILLGTAFLLHNFRPELLPLALLARYWPILLIAAGLLGLVEALFRAGRGQPPGPRPGGFGRTCWWIAIAVVCLAVFGHRVSWNTSRLDAPRFAMFGNDWDYDVNLTSNATGVKRIVFDGLRGNLAIRGEEASGDVRATGRKTIRALSRGAADLADRRFSLRMDREGDTLFIRAAAPAIPVLPVPDSAQFSADLQVVAPKGVAVESRARSGEFSVDDLDGPVSVAAGRGDVRLNHIGGDVRITGSRGGLLHASDVKGALFMQGKGSDLELITVAGPVTIEGEYSGSLEFRALAAALRFKSSRTELRAEAVPGSATLDLGDLHLNNVAGPVYFQTTSRDVHAVDVSGSLELSVNRGDLEITATRAPLARIEAKTGNGDIELTLPAAAPFDLNATTAQGDIDNGFGGGLGTRTEGRRKTLLGRSGNGPRITVSTERGAISVKRG